MTTLPQFNCEALEQLDKETLIEIILQLQTVVKQLSERVEKLEAQLAKTSQNSSKPPSSDGPVKKEKMRTRRKQSKRKSGGQPGHSGETLSQVETPDHVETHAVNTCKNCCHDLQEVPVEKVYKRQVFDVPPMTLEVTEHQVLVKTCPSCGQTNQRDFPVGVKGPVQYGQQIKAQAAYLNGYQLIPLARTQQLLRDLYGQGPSQALILKALREVEQGSQPAIEAIHEQIKQAAVVNCDETGLRVNGKQHWLHVASTPHLTAYAVHPKRGKDAMCEIGILPALTGWMVHDGWQSYRQFKQCRHALCNAHHLRELELIADHYQQTWAADMQALLCEMKAAVENDWPLSKARQDNFVSRYYSLLSEAHRANPPPAPSPGRGRSKQTPPRRLFIRLRHFQSQVLAFLFDPRVPFDNNLAERDIRMMKLHQKISGTFRTPNGAARFAHLRSYISTLRKQGQSVIDTLYNTFLGDPFIPAPALPE